MYSQSCAHRLRAVFEERQKQDDNEGNCRDPVGDEKTCRVKTLHVGVPHTPHRIVVCGRNHPRRCTCLILTASCPQCHLNPSWSCSWSPILWFASSLLPSLPSFLSPVWFEVRVFQVARQLFRQNLSVPDTSSGRWCCQARRNTDPLLGQSLAPGTHLHQIIEATGRKTGSDAHAAARFPPWETMVGSPGIAQTLIELPCLFWMLPFFPF
ncbi:uncharacterized protein C16orf74 homolog isoform X1 [Symphalangus syndactylus]|uniref:uncharacterized protein C16orf74 homolog isoform X1 n=1 Tax=Symphalangus syndactylus TaxID=9590 RepID=UPI0030064274